MRERNPSAPPPPQANTDSPPAPPPMPPPDITALGTITEGSVLVVRVPLDGWPPEDWASDTADALVSAVGHHRFAVMVVPDDWVLSIEEVDTIRARLDNIMAEEFEDTR